MISVGKYRIVHFASYLQMANEEARIEFEIFNGLAKFRVKFEVSEADEEKRKLVFSTGPDESDDESGLITFKNWNKESFRATDEPTTVAIINDQNVYLIYAISYSNGLYHVRMQFMENTVEEEAQSNG